MREGKLGVKRAQEAKTTWRKWDRFADSLQHPLRFDFMFKPFCSAGEQRHKPASLWSPTRHMKNETLHCQLIHLRKSLNWDMNFKAQWRRGIWRINTGQLPGRRQREKGPKCPHVIVYYECQGYLNCPLRFSQQKDSTLSWHETSSLQPFYSGHYFYIAVAFLRRAVKTSPTNHLAAFVTHTGTVAGRGDLVTMITTRADSEGV